jgi:hypothetical protein
MPTAGSAGINKNNHTIRPIYLSISVSFIDSHVNTHEIPAGATDAPIPIPITCKVRQVLRRLRQTFFHAQLASVNLALIPDLKHFLKAYICSDKTIQLRSLCLHMRCSRHAPICSPLRAEQAYGRQAGSEGGSLARDSTDPEHEPTAHGTPHNASETGKPDSRSIFSTSPTRCWDGMGPAALARPVWPGRSRDHRCRLPATGVRACSLPVRIEDPLASRA